MLDANKINDLNELSKYGKTKGFLVAKRYKLPTYSNFIIIENEDDVKQLLDIYKEQNDFCMRSDTKVENTSIGIRGQNGNRQTLLEYFRRVKQKARELGVNGVAIVYWNDGKFCPTYETEGCFYLDFRTNNELIIDYIGKGWDGSCLSHGSACHETYSIPWDDILFLDEKNRRKYRQKVDENKEYCKANNKYTGASRKSEELNDIYKDIAEKYNCYFLSNQGLETGIDGVHLTKESHKKLAEKLKEKISQIYN